MEYSNGRLTSFLKQAELNPLDSEERGPQNGHDTSFSSAFLIELVHRIKNTLAPIKKFTPLEIMPRCSLRARGPLGRRLQRG
jgi:hypothetical protein